MGVPGRAGLARRPALAPGTRSVVLRSVPAGASSRRLLRDAAFQSTSYRAMHGAVCLAANDCWFGGDPLEAPGAGAFQLHLDGATMTASPSRAQGHAVEEIRDFEGSRVREPSCSRPTPRQNETHFRRCAGSRGRPPAVLRIPAGRAAVPVGSRRCGSAPFTSAPTNSRLAGLPRDRPAPGNRRTRAAGARSPATRARMGAGARSIHRPATTRLERSARARARHRRASRHSARTRR